MKNPVEDKTAPLTTGSVVHVVRRRSDETLGFKLVVCDVLQRLESPGYIQVRSREDDGSSPPFVTLEQKVHRSHSSALRECERIILLTDPEIQKNGKFKAAVKEFRETGSSRERLIADAIREEVIAEVSRVATNDESAKTINAQS